MGSYFSCLERAVCVFEGKEDEINRDEKLIMLKDGWGMQREKALRSIDQRLYPVLSKPCF